MDEPTALARSIAALRQAHHMKLASVSRKVPTSTIHAIESGALVPSPDTLDLLTAAFQVPTGYFDLLCLAIDQKPHQQKALVDRLLQSGITPPTEIRQVLIELAANPNFNAYARSTVELLIARTWIHEGDTTPAIELLEPLDDKTRTLRGTLRVDIVSSLARAYLMANRPQKALPLLLEATRQRTRGRAWESAMYNLGLTWWKLGQYDAAVDRWQATIDQTSDVTLKAHAHLGLGNADLRSGRHVEALVHYQNAFHLYHEATSPNAILALNNIAMCHIQGQEWEKARTALKAIPRDRDLNAAVQGQIWATWAELARGLGRTTEACQAIQSAKTLIGDEPVLSWFTVRFLEIELAENSVPGLVESIETQLLRIPDPSMVAALRTRLVQLALDEECWAEAKREVATLAHTLPIIT